jgi:hypothetical protein
LAVGQFDQPIQALERRGELVIHSKFATLTPSYGSLDLALELVQEVARVSGDSMP